MDFIERIFGIPPELHCSALRSSRSPKTEQRRVMVGHKPARVEVKITKAHGFVRNTSHRRADGIAGRGAPSLAPDQRVRRGSLLPRSWAPVRALPRVAGLSAARFAGLTRPLAAAMATVSYSAA